MLLIQFFFPSYDGNSHGNSLSLDKYLTADVWSQIYDKLKPTIGKYQPQATELLEGETIVLRRAQIELKTTWKKAKSWHQNIIQQLNRNGDSSQNADTAHVLMVSVGMVSALEKYKKQYGVEKKAEKRPTESVEGESSTPGGSVVKETRSSNESKMSQEDEEYVPASVTDLPACLNYTPSTKSNSVDNEQNEYEPPVVNGNSNLQPTYTPSKKIPTTVSKATKAKTDSSEKPKKQHCMKTIFGGDSGDDNDSDSKSESRSLRSTQKTPQTDADKPKTFQTSIDGYMTNRSKRTDTKKDCDRSDDKKKIRKIAAQEKIDCNAAKRIEDEKMRKLREECELMDFSIEVDANL